MKEEVVHSTKTSVSISSHFPLTENDPVRVFDTLNRLYLDIETKNNASSLAKSDDDITYKESCYITHKDTFYFYGGSKVPKQISKFDCHQSKMSKNYLKFNFVDGTCSSNNKNILLCFPIENKRLCYKSNSPFPTKWWEWYTYVELSYATHDAISLSSGKSKVCKFFLNLEGVSLIS